MDLQTTLQELGHHIPFQEFKKEYPTSFLSAVFITLAPQEKLQKLQFDFFLPEHKKVAAFEYPFGEVKIYDDKIESMTSITTTPCPDFPELEGNCKILLEKNSIKLKPTKTIAILKDNLWNITLMDDVLNIARIKIDAVSGKEISVGKAGLMDFIKIEKK